jgi:hypothetical protein
LLLLIPACASPGEAGFQRGGTSIGENRDFYFETWQMSFAKTGPALPISLSRDNNGPNLLRMQNACDPSLAGVGLYPAVMAVGDAPGGTNSEFQVLLKGPAALRVRTTYAVPYQCGGSTQQLTATSTFTFFSNGRLIRTDENIVAAQQPLTDSAGCSTTCKPNAPFDLTSFWAFVPSMLVNEQGAVETPIRDKPACVIAEGLTVGVKYTGTGVQAVDGPSGPTVQQSLGPGMSSSWPGDLAPQRAQSQVVLRSGTNPADCGRVLATLNDPPLLVDGQPVEAVDGIYQATTQPHRGATQIKTPAAMPDGFALEIDLGGATHARFLFNGEVSAYYLVENDGPYPIFFLPPITSTDTLTIEPVD